MVRVATDVPFSPSSARSARSPRARRWRERRGVVLASVSTVAGAAGAAGAGASVGSPPTGTSGACSATGATSTATGAAAGASSAAVSSRRGEPAGREATRRRRAGAGVSRPQSTPAQPGCRRSCWWPAAGCGRATRLALLDRGDEITLAHFRGVRNVQLTRELAQLREHHRAQAPAAAGAGQRRPGCAVPPLRARSGGDEISFAQRSLVDRPGTLRVSGFHAHPDGVCRTAVGLSAASAAVPNGQDDDHRGTGEGPLGRFAGSVGVLARLEWPRG